MTKCPLKELKIKVLISKKLNRLMTFFAAKSCEMYPAPENGALACNAWGISNRFCQVSCNQDFDFAFAPAISYLCGNGKWTPIGGPPPPWPGCSGKFI